MRTSLPAFSVVVIVIFGIYQASLGQEGAKKIGELPVFQALNGERTESGILIPKAGAEPIQGSAKSIGQPAIAGLWYQIEGHAKYGPVEWIYRWMFVFSDTANLKVHARYIDTMGQLIDYQGLYDPENKRLQLIGNLSDGTARFQMTLEDGGTVRIDSVLEKATGDATVTYTAENTAAAKE